MEKNEDEEKKTAALKFLKLFSIKTKNPGGRAKITNFLTLLTNFGKHSFTNSNKTHMDTTFLSDYCIRMI